MLVSNVDIKYYSKGAEEGDPAAEQQLQAPASSGTDSSGEEGDEGDDVGVLTFQVKSEWLTP